MSGWSARGKRQLTGIVQLRMEQSHMENAF